MLPPHKPLALSAALTHWAPPPPSPALPGWLVFLFFFIDTSATCYHMIMIILLIETLNFTRSDLPSDKSCEIF